MAIFGKDRERNDRSRSTGSDSPVFANGPAGEAVMTEREGTRGSVDEAGGGAFLGRGSKVTGKLVFEGPVRIEGHVDGEITAQDTLTIGEHAVVNAAITGSAVVVHGRVTGDITAKKRLEIRAPGRLFGNISTPTLVIHEGVVFEGQCSMGGEAQRGERDRKVTPFPKEDRPVEVPGLKLKSEAVS